MFSNLRTEELYPSFSTSFSTSPTTSCTRSSSNHLFIPTSWDIYKYQHNTITIYNTNLPSLYKFQVNLASYFSKGTILFNHYFNISNEFWITPPVWKYPMNTRVIYTPSQVTYIARVLYYTYVTLYMYYATIYCICMVFLT